MYRNNQNYIMFIIKMSYNYQHLLMAQGGGLFLLHARL